MLLSYAILFGSLASEQGFGWKSAQKSSLKKCPIGAALLAVGQESDEQPSLNALKEWPWLANHYNAPVLLPLYVRPTAMTIIWQLNDIQKWTRTRIAAWVAAIEPLDQLTDADCAVLNEQADEEQQWQQINQEDVESA